MLFSVFTVFNARSDEQSAFVGMFSNKWLGFAPGSSAAGGRGLHALPATGILNRQPLPGGLAVLHSGCKHSAVAAGVEQAGADAMRNWTPADEDLIKSLAEDNSAQLTCAAYSS